MYQIGVVQELLTITGYHVCPQKGMPEVHVKLSELIDLTLPCGHIPESSCKVYSYIALVATHAQH